MATILVLHGPNLNLLGAREPDLYGNKNLDAINQDLMDICKKRGCNLLAFQSNSEHILIERIHAAKKESAKFIIFNPAAFTHTSIAWRDAMLAVNIPYIEVHLSNVSKRESFRHESLLTPVCVGCIMGFGLKSYDFGVEYFLKKG